MFEAEVLLYVHRSRRLIRDGSLGRPPRLSHSSWALDCVWVFPVNSMLRSAWVRQCGGAGLEGRGGTSLSHVSEIDASCMSQSPGMSNLSPVCSCMSHRDWMGNLSPVCSCMSHREWLTCLRCVRASCVFVCSCCVVVVVLLVCVCLYACVCAWVYVPLSTCASLILLFKDYEHYNTNIQTQ